MKGVLLLTLFGLLGVVALGEKVSGQEASSSSQGTDGLLVRIGGDALVPPDGDYDAVLVFDGNASVRGRSAFVLVVGGEARLAGGQVEHVIVADGALRLEEGAVVTGDAELFRASLEQGEDTFIRGEVREEPLEHAFKGAWFFGAFLAIGFAVAIIGAGLVATAIAPDGVRQVGAALVTGLPQTLVATALVWLALPMAAILVMPTVVAVPAALGVFLFILPALGFLGFVLAGIALGRAVMHSLKGGAARESPYLIAVLGLGLLLVACLLPLIGGVVAPLAGAVGSGALVATLWQRAARFRSRAAEGGSA